jgi:hypothetical protein
MPQCTLTQQNYQKIKNKFKKKAQNGEGSWWIHAFFSTVVP